MADRESSAPAYGTNVRIIQRSPESVVHPPYQTEGGALMEPVENILEEYRNADAEYRLDLFLAHRDLRDRFTAIEADEEAGGAPSLSTLHPKSSVAFA